MEDLDELALVGLIADVSNPRAEGQQSLDRGAVQVGRRGLDPRGHALDHRGGDRVHGIVLGREVKIERSLRDAGGADDVVDGRRGDTLRREDGDGRFYELVAADLAPRGRVLRDCHARIGSQVTDGQSVLLREHARVAAQDVAYPARDERRCGLATLTVEEPDLEELFFMYYQDQDETARTKDGASRATAAVD
jgi:hypothetical protein